MSDASASAQMTGGEPTQPFDWVDLIATLVMALAALLTAWSAFQSDQWGDTVSFSLAQSTAARAEATRAYAQAGQLKEIDVSSFFAWTEAVQFDVAQGRLDPVSRFEPDPETLAGFLYLRFRPEFRKAVDAWLESDPLANPAAPATPFELDDYRISKEADGLDLEVEADRLYAEAQAADANDDKYVLTTIAFAAIFLFAGMSTKMRSSLSQHLMLGFGILFLVGATVFLITIPILV